MKEHDYFKFIKDCEDAKDTQEQEYFGFEENDEGYTLTSYYKIDEPSVTKIEIPAAYNGKPVTEIGNCAFIEAPFIETVIIPDSVIQIGYEAFSGCESLEKINLPSGLTNILDESFSGCTKLRAIEIPEGVTEIGEYAFNSCYMLKDIKLPKSLKIIGPRVFSRISESCEIELPDDLEQLGEGAFADSEDASIIFKGKTYTQKNIEELYNLFK